MTHSDALSVHLFAISCVTFTISIALVSVVDLSFVFVLLLQSIDSSCPLSLLGCWDLIWTTKPFKPLNPWTHRYLVLTSSSVSLQGHNTLMMFHLCSGPIVMTLHLPFHHSPLIFLRLWGSIHGHSMLSSCCAGSLGMYDKACPICTNRWLGSTVMFLLSWVPWS